MKNVDVMLKGNFQFKINKTLSKKCEKFESLLIKTLILNTKNNFNSLKNVSLNIHRGDKILIHGASGEGKSNFPKLLVY